MDQLWSARIFKVHVCFEINIDEESDFVPSQIDKKTLTDFNTSMV